MPLLTISQTCDDVASWQNNCCGSEVQGGVRHLYFVRKSYYSNTLLPALLLAMTLANDTLRKAGIETALNAAITAGVAFKIADVMGTIKSNTETGDGFGNNETEVQGATVEMTVETKNVINNLPNAGALNGLRGYVLLYASENHLWDTRTDGTLIADFDFKDRKSKTVLPFKYIYRVKRDAAGNLLYPDHYLLPDDYFECTPTPNITYGNRTGSNPRLYNFLLSFLAACAGGGTLTLVSVTGSVSGNVTANFNPFSLVIPNNNVATMPFPITENTPVAGGQTLDFKFELTGCGIDGTITENVLVSQ